MKLLNKILVWFLYSGVYLVDRVSLSLNFQQVYSVGERFRYYTCLLTCMCV